MASSRTRASYERGRGAISLAGCSWLGFFLFYWWLIAKAQMQQLVAGALCGLFVVVGLFALSREAGLRFNIKPSWIGLLLRRVPARVLRDLALLAALFW